MIWCRARVCGLMWGWGLRAQAVGTSARGHLGARLRPGPPSHPPRQQQGRAPWSVPEGPRPRRCRQEAPLPAMAAGPPQVRASCGSVCAPAPAPRVCDCLRPCCARLAWALTFIVLAVGACCVACDLPWVLVVWRVACRGCLLCGVRVAVVARCMACCGVLPPGACDGALQISACVVVASHPWQRRGWADAQGPCATSAPQPKPLAFPKARVAPSSS
jgi:hypothetical protein